jgi:UDP-glucose 4-epimerase
VKILVTGGAGFIGSHVVDAYVAAGHAVVVVDSLTTGRREVLNPRARFVELDIRDPALREVFRQERPEVVNHHAAQASVPASVADPAHDADVNIMGTLNLLELCREFGVRRFVFASTGGAIYGEPERLPADEAHPTQPLSPYGISKMAGEHYVRFFGGAGMSWAILRYANVYGPRQDPHGEAGVVAIFTNAMLAGNRPKIFGDGTQTRDFVYVEDAARANLLAAAVEASGLANIATGVETSVEEIYRLLAEATGFGDPPVYEPPRPGDVYRIALDPRRAEEWLGWTADVSLADGLRRTVEWFRRRTVE